jgi:hypothetical protein
MRGAGPPHGLPPGRSLRSRSLHGNLAGAAGQNAFLSVGAGSRPALAGGDQEAENG